MKNFVPSVLFIALFLMGGLNCIAQGKSNCKITPDVSAATPKVDAKQIPGTCTQTKTSRENSNPDYSISINGKDNTLKIGTAGATEQSTDTRTNQPGNNTVEINGEGNSVSISQDTTGKVAVKQNGKNNRVSITQTAKQP